jgi:tRNA(fMet)-specific endonuclease VapC
MNGNSGFLLDTNIVIAILNQESVIEDRLKGQQGYIAAISVGELYYGAYKSGRVTDNVQRLEKLLAGYSVVVCDRGTAEAYGRIKLTLKSKGRPIPENDIWIAAIAMQHGLTLVTRDEHFDAIDNLQTETW